MNEIICGDCIEVMKQFDNNSIDLVVTDPPFGINYKKLDWDKIDIKNMLIQLDKEFLRILKDGCYYFIWLPKNELVTVGSYLTDIKYFMELLPFGGWSVKRMLPRCIPIIFKVKNKERRDICGGKNYYITNSAYTGKEDRNPRVIPHPAAKSYETCIDIIKKTSLEKETVLDPFCGSGSTGVACKMLNRNFIGIDINEEYVELTKKRLERTTPKQNVGDWF